MTALSKVQSWLRTTELAGIVIPSADEFLSEFSPPVNRRLRWTTGFRGSTGLAIILRDSAALFLDGRYQLQGTYDTQGTGIVVAPATLPSRQAWLQRSMPAGAHLGIDSWLHSMTDLAHWRTLAIELGFEIDLLADNPINRLWSQERPPPHRPRIVDYPIQYAGDTREAKCTALVEHLNSAGIHALLVADPEDVSWLLNVRAADDILKTEVGDWHVVPSCASRVLVYQDGRVEWFVDEDRLTPEVAAHVQRLVALTPSDRIEASLRKAAQRGLIGINPHRTSAALVTAIGGESRVRSDDIVAQRRWRKHPAEVQGARQAHIIDAVAVTKFMAWLTRIVSQAVVTEFEAAQKLEALRSEHPAYKGASMPLMSASGRSGAQPHYVPQRVGSRKLNDHPIYWMDSGGQYLGGTTDNTITLAVGTPDRKHVLAHTLVLQGFITLATARIPEGTPAFRADPIARQALWREGMDYAHGTGHGVGNYLNIHELPVLTRDPGPLSSIPIEPGMILSNEPAYYADDDFGVRIESHMVVVPAPQPGFVEFDTISRLPIDPRLVDFDRLTQIERQWLADYHQKVLRDIEPLLDPLSAAWLRGIVSTFVAATTG